MNLRAQPSNITKLLTRLGLVAIMGTMSLSSAGCDKGSGEEGDKETQGDGDTDPDDKDSASGTDGTDGTDPNDDDGDAQDRVAEICESACVKELRECDGLEQAEDETECKDDCMDDIKDILDDFKDVKDCANAVQDFMACAYKQSCEDVGKILDAFNRPELDLEGECKEELEASRKACLGGDVPSGEVAVIGGRTWDKVNGVAHVVDGGKLEFTLSDKALTCDSDLTKVAARVTFEIDKSASTLADVAVKIMSEGKEVLDAKAQIVVKNLTSDEVQIMISLGEDDDNEIDAITILDVCE